MEDKTGNKLSIVTIKQKSSLAPALLFLCDPKHIGSISAFAALER